MGAHGLLLTSPLYTGYMYDLSEVWASPFTTLVGRSATDVTISNSVTLTNVFTTTVLERSLGTAGHVRCYVMGKVTNTTGAGRTLTFTLSLGGTSLGTAVVTVADGLSAAPLLLDAVFAADGSVTSTYLNAIALLDTAIAAHTRSITTTPTNVNNLALTVDVTLSAASASFSYTKEYATAEVQ